jgi:leader peptidase (prepilin peptidase)/N-methyltransferase
MGYALSAVGGLMLGSFLNVVAWRLPRGESLSRPGSHCPSCDAPVRPYDNVPVLSWLLLRGRCRSCGERISSRYPLVELVTCLLFVAVLLVKGVNVQAIPGLVLVALLVPVALIDLEHRIIPNKLMAVGAVLGLVLIVLVDRGHVVEHLIAALAAGGFLLLAALAYPSGMGMGDVKLAALLGLYLGRSVAPAMLVAMLAGTIVGVVVIARKGAREGRKTAVPFGPFLALGGVVGLLAGPSMVHWYLATFVNG